MTKFPVIALLRCKIQAELRGTTVLGNEWDQRTYIVGRTQAEPCEMWHKEGKWREDGSPHPLDVVGFFNVDNTVRPLTNELS